MIIKTVHSIHEVNKKEWNAICGGVFFSYEWMLFVEENLSKEYQPHHIVCFEGTTLIGGIPAFLPTAKNDAFQDFLFGKKFRFMQKLPFFKSKALLCLSPFSFQSTIFSKNNDISIKEELLKGIEIEAKKSACTDIVFFNVIDADTERKELFKKTYYTSYLAKPTMIFENKWNTFESYVASLKPNNKKTIRNDLQHFKQHHLSITVLEHPEKEIKALATLMHNVLEHHESTIYDYSEELILSFFHHLKPYLSFYVAKDHEGFIACIAHLEKGEDFRTHLLGLDYTKTPQTRAYYVLIYYESIKKVIKKNIPFFDFGCEAYQPKKYRGCVLKKRNLFIKTIRKNFLKNMWLQLLTPYYAYKFKKMMNNIHTIGQSH
jgi:predicted N-acyltransferase